MENNNTIFTKQLQEIAEKYGKLFEELESINSGLIDASNATEKLNYIVENYDNFDAENINDRIYTIAEEINTIYDNNPEALMKDTELLNVAYNISKEIINVTKELEDIPDEIRISMTIGDQLLRLVTEHINQK